jgi:hypothetical protein
MDEQPGDGHETVVERFPPTNGRFTGILGLACAGVVLVLSLAAWDTGRALGVGIVACLGAVLVWVTLLRPALWTTEHHLVMRNMLHTDRIPLAAIGRVVVGQVLAVTVDGKRYVSPVIGYTARQTIKAKAGRGASTKAPSAVDTPQIFVEERIRHLASEHRERFGEREGTSVRRTFAWPELAAIALLVAAYLVWLLL